MKSILFTCFSLKFTLVFKSIHALQHVQSAFSSHRCSLSPKRSTTGKVSSPLTTIICSRNTSASTTRSTTIHATDNNTHSNTNETEKVKTNAIRFRPGRKDDEITMKILMTRNLMNPLNINYERFIVASNPSNDNDIYGFAQLRPLGGRSNESARDPNTFDSLPGSSSASTIVRDELNEDIWDEFENEDMEFPNGFASLPWTKEYREYMEYSKQRRERNEQRVKQIDEFEKRQGQVQRRVKDSGTTGNAMEDKFIIWELASVYVVPAWRKRGVGSELVRRVMAKQLMLERKVENVYLLTLDSTKEWYNRLGFEEVTDDPPASMQLEIAAGGIVTKFLGEKLICMQGKPMQRN